MSTTTISGHADGLVRLTANEMTTGVGMKINTKNLTTGKALHITSGTGAALESSGHLLYVQGDGETNGNIVEISARDMSNGTVLKLTNTGTGLRSGRVLHLETGATNVIAHDASSNDPYGGAVFDITANSVTTGQILRISANSMTDANMIDLLSTSTEMTANGKIINIDAKGANHGTMIDLKAPELDDGTCLLYTSPSPRDEQSSRMPSSA